MSAGLRPDWASAETGHAAAAPPISVMNFRRFMAPLRLILDHQKCACSCCFHLPLDDHRKSEHKSRALTDLRLHPDLAAVHLNDALRYGEPQAGAALLACDRIVGLLELLKQLGLVNSGDARAGVTDRDME